MHVDIKQDKKNNNSVACSIICKSSTCNESDNIHITAHQSTLEHTQTTESSFQQDKSTRPTTINNQKYERNLGKHSEINFTFNLAKNQKERIGLLLVCWKMK